ncbi:MAG: GNAT family N-acetyltransferase [Sporichthyaceae bacterium]
MGASTHEVLTDEHGVAVLSYCRAEFNHGPWADRAEPMAANAAAVAMARLPGWRVSCSEEFGAELLAAGAQPDRHARTMVRDLRAAPPPPEWLRAPAPEGIRIFPGIVRSIAEVFVLSEAAFGPEHPDRLNSHGPAERRRDLLGDLLGGKFFGPPAPGSASALGADNALVGLIAMFRLLDAGAPLAWIGTVFRDPSVEAPGLGEAMIRRALGSSAAAGLRRMGLAVTVGNPAQALYERLGFVVVETKLSVRIPDPDAVAG